MDISEDLDNINNFIKYLSINSQSISNKMEDDGKAKITIKEYQVIKNISEIITEYFNSNNDIDDDVEFLEDKPIEISDSFILKIKNNELSKDQLLSHNLDLDKKYIIFNLNCLNSY